MMPPSSAVVPDAHAWIQWKGTAACIDLHCKCGHSCHMDADFLYYWECSQCSQIYALKPNITLVPISALVAGMPAPKIDSGVEEDTPKPEITHGVSGYDKGCKCVTCRRAEWMVRQTHWTSRRSR